MIDKMFASSDKFMIFCGRYNLYVAPMMKHIARGPLIILDLTKKAPVECKMSSEKLCLMACAISSNSRFICASDSAKNMYLYENMGGCSWELFKSWPMHKRIIEVKFDPSNSFLIFSDKHGEVCISSITLKGLTTPTKVLGHAAYILDVTMSSRNEYIVTCDRDKKIRISKFPDSYDVGIYLLEHTASVIGVNLTANDHYMLSLATNGELKLWIFHERRLMQTWNVFKILHGIRYENGEVSRMRMTELRGILYISIMIERCKHVAVLAMDPMAKTLKQFGQIKAEDSFYEVLWVKEALYYYCPERTLVKRYLITEHGLISDSSLIHPRIAEVDDDIKGFASFNKSAIPLRKRIVLEHIDPVEMDGSSAPVHDSDLKGPLLKSRYKERVAHKEPSKIDGTSSHVRLGLQDVSPKDNESKRSHKYESFPSNDARSSPLGSGVNVSSKYFDNNSLSDSLRELKKLSSNASECLIQNDLTSEPNKNFKKETAHRFQDLTVARNGNEDVMTEKSTEESNNAPPTINSTGMQFTPLDHALDGTTKSEKIYGARADVETNIVLVQIANLDIKFDLACKRLGAVDTKRNRKEEAQPSPQPHCDDDSLLSSKNPSLSKTAADKTSADAESSVQHMVDEASSNPKSVGLRKSSVGKKSKANSQDPDQLRSSSRRRGKKSGTASQQQVKDPKSSLEQEINADGSTSPKLLTKPKSENQEKVDREAPSNEEQEAKSTCVLHAKIKPSVVSHSKKSRLKCDALTVLEQSKKQFSIPNSPCHEPECQAEQSFPSVPETIKPAMDIPVIKYQASDKSQISKKAKKSSFPSIKTSQVLSNMNKIFQSHKSKTNHELKSKKHMKNIDVPSNSPVDGSPPPEMIARENSNLEESKSTIKKILVFKGIEEDADANPSNRMKGKSLFAVNGPTGSEDPTSERLGFKLRKPSSKGKESKLKKILKKVASGALSSDTFSKVVGNFAEKLVGSDNKSDNVETREQKLPPIVPAKSVIHVLEAEQCDLAGVSAKGMNDSEVKSVMSGMNPLTAHSEPPGNYNFPLYRAAPLISTMFSTTGKTDGTRLPRLRRRTKENLNKLVEKVSESHPLLPSKTAFIHINKKSTLNPQLIPSDSKNAPTLSSSSRKLISKARRKNLKLLGLPTHETNPERLQESQKSIYRIHSRSSVQNGSGRAERHVKVSEDSNAHSSSRSDAKETNPRDLLPTVTEHPDELLFASSLVSHTDQIVSRHYHDFEQAF